MTESEFDPAERDSALIRLVDDEPDVRAALSLMLEIEGWRCVSYASAREFLVENMDSPGCLVLDVRMPGMSGLELQQAMEERGIELPVIFLTGHGDLDTAIQSLKRGAVDFLLKPPSSASLSAPCRATAPKSTGSSEFIRARSSRPCCPTSCASSADEAGPAVLRRRPPLSSSRMGRNRLPLTFSKLRA